MTSARTFLIGLVVLAAAGTATAAPGVYAPTQTFAPIPSPPKAEPFHHYKYNSPYGDDPTRLAPRAKPYESNGPGGYRRPTRDEDSDRGTLKRQGGTFGR